MIHTHPPMSTELAEPIRLFLDALANAEPSARLHVYAESSLQLTAHDVEQCFVARHELCGWLALRFEAGPPGQVLPSPQESAARLQTGGASLADVVAWLLTPGKAVAAPDVLLSLLERFLTVALRFQAPHCVRRCSRGLAILHFLVQDPRPPRRALEQLAEDPRHAKSTAMWRALVETLAANPALARDPWVRVAAANFWSNSGTEVPARIDINPWLAAAIDTNPYPVLAALRDEAVAAPFAQALTDVVSLLVYERLAAHPLVERLRRIANYGGHIEELRELEPTEELGVWAAAASQRDEVESARLAAWLLHMHDRLPASELCAFIRRAPHAEDLPLLAEQTADDRVRAMLLKLASAARPLPDELADEFVRLFLFGPEYTLGLMRCHPHAETLRRAATDMESPFRELAAAILASCDAVDRAAAAAAPAWEAVVARARDLVEQCGDQPLGGDELDELLSTVELPPLNQHALVFSDRSFDALPPTERLFAAALVLHHAPSSLSGWRASFEERLIHAVIHSEASSLFPRAIALLDGLLHRGDGERYARAELLHFKAKTLAAGATNRAERLAAAGLYRQAVDEARKAGLIRLRIHALTAWVRLALLGAQLGDEQTGDLIAGCSRELDALDDDARQFGMLPELYEARAILARHARDFVASARWYREALGVSDEHEHPAACSDLRCNLAETLLFTHDPQALAEAEEHARAALRLLRDDRGPASLTLASAVLGMILLHRSDDPSGDALTLLEDAIRVPRESRGVTGVGQLRLSLAEAYRRAGRTSEAAAQVRRIFDEGQDEHDLPLLIEATFFGVHLEQDDGLREAERRLQQLLERHPRGPKHTLLELARALLLPEQTELSALLAWAASYVRREVPRHATVERALIDFIGQAATRLPHDFLRLCLDAEFFSEYWHTHARVLFALGECERLRELTGRILAGDPPLETRRTALLHRLQALPGSDPEISATLTEVETLLDEGPDEPHLRAQFAQALYHRASGDPSVLARAWQHIERAAPHLTAPDVQEQVWRLQAAIRAAQLTALGPVSGREQVELATWFGQELPLPGPDVEEMRVAVIRQLLFVGPLTHPDALTLAQYFLARLAAPEFGPLSRQIAWIGQEQRKPGTSEPLRATDESPARSHFDGAPAWVIDIVVRGGTDRPVALDDESFGWLFQAVRVRPDRADVLLAWLAQRPAAELAGLAQMIHALCLDGDRRHVSSQLLEQLELALEDSPSFALRRLQVQLLAATFDWGDGTAYAAAADALLTLACTPEERAEALFFKGVERLDASHAHRAAESTGPDPIVEARRIFDAATEMVRASSVPAELGFTILVSTGNSYRDGDAPDPERALALYAEARTRGAPDAHSHAKLCKVTADALVLRDAAGDLDRAEQLLEEALAIRRSGWLRAETLLSVVDATLAREDRPWVSRLRTALHRLAEAQEHDDGRNRTTLALRRRQLATRLLAERPKDGDATAVLAEVAAIVEDGADERARHADVLNRTRRSDLESLVELLNDRSAADLGEFAQPLRVLRVEAAERPPAAEITAAVRAKLTELDARGDDLSPGAWLAKAQLQAYLAEHDLADPRDAANAAERAERGLEAIEPPLVRAFLFSELVFLWSPENHWSHPVRDFRRAASLAERALAWVPPDHALHHDLAANRARATRYRTDGDIRQHMLRAEELYASLLRELEGTGPGLAEQIAVNLEEVRTALQHGNEEVHLRQAVAAARRAVGSDQVTMMNRIALARDLTLLGCRLSDPEGSRLLDEAEENWAALPWERMSKAELESADNYRAICTAERCRRRDDLRGVFAVWRARLERCDREADPYAWALAAHNYADNLVRDGDDEDRAAEALRLAHAALEFRTPAGNLKHHWETCQTIGDAALVLLRRQAEDLVGLTTEALVERSIECLRSSLDVAIKLGGGDRRFKAAFRFALVARFVANLSRRAALLEQAWSHLDAARPFLLSDQRAAVDETRLAQDIALQLAGDLARQGPVGVGPGLRFVFEGERARLVLPWLLRGVGGAQRRLAARSRRPREVDVEAWVRWTRAVQGENPVEIGRALTSIREQAPGFLSASPDLRGLEQWLRTHDDPAVVIPIFTQKGLLTAVLERGDPMRSTIALLAASAPPAREPDIASTMTTGRHWSPPYRNTLEWARRAIVTPIERLLAGRLRNLLWCPPDVLRMLSPANLWPGVAVTSTVDPCVRAAGADRIWGRTALFVADPDVDPGRIPGSLEIARRLAARAAVLGGVRARVSRGPRFGEGLGAAISGLVNAPANPTGFLEEALEAQLIVLVAHGFVEPPFTAELTLVEADGRVTALPLHTIAQDPRRIVGKTFLLLSCETGRTGTWTHQAGGLAGALLSCGARRVIAPLWPVLVSPAIDVGEAMLVGLAVKQDPAQILAELSRATGELTDGPAVSTGAFVVWCA